MKSFKRIMATLLVLISVISITGCHKKGEIAVTVGDVKFTSAYYMCALLEANNRAMTQVYQNINDAELSGTIEFDVYSKKIDGKDFKKWVKDTALDNLKLVGAYKMLCEEHKLEISEEEREANKDYSKQCFQNRYSPAGYLTEYEANGVSLETLTQYILDMNYAELYFDFIYGAEGKKAIPQEDVNSKIYGKHVLANVLNYTYTADMKDTAKAEIKDKFNAYANELKNGTRTFEEIYKEYNGITEENQTETEDVNDFKNKYAGVLGDEDTYYASSYYNSVKDLKIGETAVIEAEDSNGLILIHKLDISSDEYHLEMLDTSSRHLIADEEFEKDMKDHLKTLNVDVNKYAIGQFKVKEIIIPRNY